MLYYYTTSYYNYYFFFSFKEILWTITDTTGHTINFLQSVGTTKTSKKCPGPFIDGCQLHNCGKDMLLKPTNDRNDGVTWRCRKVHHVCKNEKKYTVKDVKISIWSDTWLLDSNLSLNVIVELIYLWTQRFTSSELQHELKIGKQTLN